MKNTAIDYFTQLRNDYIPKKKNQYDHLRRPFNPGDPAELLLLPAPKPEAAHANSEAACSTNTGI